MIIYRAQECPPWLDGAADLCIRQGAGCVYYGVCDPAYFSPPEKGWARVADGIDAAIVGRATDYPLQRRQTVACITAESATGERWAVPRILTAAGERAFPVPIGPDWLPEPTTEQAHAIAVATAARATLIADHESGGAGIDSAAAARWAADLLSFSNHITPEVLLALRLLDEALVLATITGASCGNHDNI